MDTTNKDKLAYAEVIRSMLECENRLLNDRINWLVTIQGLLFAALGFAWDKQDAKGLIVVFSVLGVVVSVSAGRVLGLYTKARRELVKWWDKNQPPDYQGPDVIEPI